MTNVSNYGNISLMRCVIISAPRNPISSCTEFVMYRPNEVLYSCSSRVTSVINPRCGCRGAAPNHLFKDMKTSGW